MEDFFDFSRLSFNDGKIYTKPVKPNTDNNSCIDSLPLTMAYVPMQAFGTQYDPEAGLCRGTIFPDLDKPFVGCKNNWRGH